MNQASSLPNQAAVVIVGGGMAGLSCAASLARRGIRDVVLLEAKTLAHAKASSFGETRMFREMYSDPVLCKLAQARWICVSPCLFVTSLVTTDASSIGTS